MREMFRFSYHVAGTAPATLLDRNPQESAPTRIRLFSYDENNLSEYELKDFAELEETFDPKRTNWIDLQGLGDLGLLEALGRKFDLHPLALEDVLNTAHRPKMESHGTNLFIISAMIYFDQPDELNAEQLSLFVGDNFVISLQEQGGEDLFERIRQRLRSGHGHMRSRRSDYLAYAILDAVVDNNYPVLETVGEGLAEIEELLLAKPNRDTLRRLYEIKRLLLQVRRVIWPHREVFSSLLRDESGIIQPSTHIFLRDCYDHTTQLIDMVESYRDLSAGLMDVYISSVGIRTNEIMRVLTLVSTFFIPLTFMAGVYGMNFDTASPYNMPELKWPFGYLFFWGLCAVVSLAMFIFFRRKRWV
jgi:magnesium transporter